MTGEVQEWVRRCVEKYPDLAGNVLEVGSLDVCGNPRHHFNDKERFPSYIGVDKLSGPGVDKICDVIRLPWDDASFDIVLSLEMIEHDRFFWESMIEIGRVLKKGGYLILTSRSWRGCGPHHIEDYWRFLEDGLRVCLAMAGCETLETLDSIEDGGTFALGRKL